jgi:uncharacterized protein (DUF885 family)
MKAWIMCLGVVALFAGVAVVAQAAMGFREGGFGVEDLLKFNPETATLLGDHRYDAKLTDRSAQAIAAQVAMSRDYLAKLSAIDPGTLSQTNAIDYEILKSNLDRVIFESEGSRAGGTYLLNMGSGIYSRSRDFARRPASASVKGRLEVIPSVIAAEGNQEPAEICMKTAMQ